MTPTRMSRLETAIRIVLEFNEAFNHRDIQGMMQLISKDCIFESADPAPDGTMYAGEEAITCYWQDQFRQSPQTHIDIEEIFSTGFRCIMRWKSNWVDPVGTNMHIRGVDIFKVKDGSICEQFSYAKG